MSKVITPEYLAEVRARQNVKELAFRLHAYCAASWPFDLDFSFIEEEIRETLVLCAINLRRLIEIADLKDRLPAFTSKVGNQGEWASGAKSFWTVVNAIPHLQRLKCEVDSSGNEHVVKELLINTDTKTMFFEPQSFARTALQVLENPQTEYKIQNPREQEP